MAGRSERIACGVENSDSALSSGNAATGPAAPTVVATEDREVVRLPGAPSPAHHRSYPRRALRNAWRNGVELVSWCVDPRISGLVFAGASQAINGIGVFLYLAWLAIPFIVQAAMNPATSIYLQPFA